MFGLRRAISCIAIVLASSDSCVAAEIDNKKIDAAIDRALNEWQAPGAAVAIVSADKILYLQGRGIREKGKPESITSDTIFPLASCGKGFTTTLLAMLADEHKLSWDDPVRKHLKEFHLSDPLADGDVRLRDLVSHRTGVAGHDLLWYRAPWSQEEMIRRIGKVALSQPFRTAMQYQSIMFMAAGQASANAVGKPWHEMIKERIFKPLEMKSATLTTTAAFKQADRASAHRKGKDGVEVIPWYEMREPNPAGSINASVRDLSIWLQFHLNEGRHGDHQLVSAENLKVTHSPHTIIEMKGANQEQHPFTHQMSYGMAWVIQDYRGELLVSHAGLIDGFRCHLTLLPKRKLGIAILCNMNQTRLNLALSNTIVDMLLDAPAKDWNDHYRKIVEAEDFAAKVQKAQLERNRKRGTTPTLALEAYEGTYEEPAYGTAKVRLEKGELFLDWSSFRCKLEHFQDDVFRVLDEQLGRTLLEFHVEGGKRVASMTAISTKFTKK